MTEALQQEIRTLKNIFESERDPEGRVFAPLADAYRRAGEIQAAVRLLNEGLARHPHFVPGHVVAAQLYVEQGLAEEAAIAARHALGLDRENVHALRSLLRVLEEGGDGEADEVRARLVELEPGFVAERERDVPAAGPPPLPTTGDAPGAPEMDDRPPALPATAGGEGALDADGPPVLDLTSELGLAEGVDEPLIDLDSLAGASDADDYEQALTLVDSAPETGFELPTEEPVVDLDDLAPVGGDFTSEGPTFADPSPPLAAELPELEPSGFDEPVMELADLGPPGTDGVDDEPVMELAELAPEVDDEPVMELAELAPDADDDELVMDLAELAPEVDDEPVMELAELAPDELAEADEPVMELAALAPDADDDELVMDLAELAPDADDDEPVMELAALAPDEPEEADEPVMELAALAPDADDDELVMDLAELAPEVDDDEPVMDLADLAPDDDADMTLVDLVERAGPKPLTYDMDEAEEEEVEEIEEVVVDMDALGPPTTAAADAGDAEVTAEDTPSAEPGEDSSVEDDEADDHGPGEPVYTRTLAELYVKQGVIGQAIEVYQHLAERKPDDASIRERIRELESGAVEGEELEGVLPEEVEEEVEKLARELAEAREGAHDDVESPFTMEHASEEATEEPSGPTIGDYFSGLLGWKPEERP